VVAITAALHDKRVRAGASWGHLGARIHPIHIEQCRNRAGLGWHDKVNAAGGAGLERALSERWNLYVNLPVRASGSPRGGEPLVALTVFAGEHAGIGVAGAELVGRKIFRPTMFVGPGQEIAVAEEILQMREERVGVRPSLDISQVLGRSDRTLSFTPHCSGVICVARLDRTASAVFLTVSKPLKRFAVSCSC
jgi:hypothetical protein